MSLFPTTLFQWALFVASFFIFSLLALFLLNFLWRRLVRLLPAGPRWVLPALVGVGLFSYAGFIFCALWAIRWNDASDIWISQVKDWLGQGCSPHEVNPYAPAVVSGDWVFYTPWAFFIPGHLLFFLIRWGVIPYFRRQQQATAHIQGSGGRKRDQEGVKRCGLFALLFGGRQPLQHSDSFPVCGKNLLVSSATNCGSFQMRITSASLPMGSQSVSVIGVLTNISSQAVQIAVPLTFIAYRWPDTSQVLPQVAPRVHIIVTLQPGGGYSFNMVLAVPLDVHDLGIEWWAGPDYVSWHLIV